MTEVTLTFFDHFKKISVNGRKTPRLGKIFAKIRQLIIFDCNEMIKTTFRNLLLVLRELSR